MRSERMLVTLLSVTLLCAMVALGLLVLWRVLTAFPTIFG